MKNILITGSTDFGNALAARFTAEGYRVRREGEVSGPPLACPLDLYIDTTDMPLPGDTFTLTEGVNTAVIEEAFRENVLAPMALLERFLPYLEAGEGKRLCWLSSRVASLNETRDIRGYGYNMAKTALHQFIQMVSNRLTKEGYTFRVFDPLAGEVPCAAAAGAAFYHFTRRRGTENHNAKRDDETRLTLYDALGRAHSW